MEKQFVLTAFIVSFGITFVQPHDELATSDGNDGSQIQANVRNLFNSIMKNDWRKTDNFLSVLELEAGKEQRAFAAMKKELQLARRRNPQKRTNFENDRTIEAVAAVKREANNDDGPNEKRSPVKLYHDVMCPQSRAVLILLNLLNIDHTIEYVDLASSTEFYPQILEMNPENIVPIIDDNGQILSNSHAINAYLVDKYAPNDTLYPKDVAERARVNHMLHLDTGLIYPLYKGDTTKVFNRYMARMMSGLGVEIVKTNNRVYQQIQDFLKKSTYIAGEHPTIADISIYSSLTQIDLYEPPDRKDYEFVVDYLKRCEENIDYLKDITAKGLEAYSKFVKNIKFKKFEKAKKARKEAEEKKARGALAQENRLK